MLHPNSTTAQTIPSFLDFVSAENGSVLNQLEGDVSLSLLGNKLNKTLPPFLNSGTNYHTSTQNELYQIIGVNKRQHFKIQNLQKANLYLKSKLKELQSPYEESNSLDQGQSDVSYQLVSVGPVETLNKLEEQQRRKPFYQENFQSQIQGDYFYEDDNYFEPYDDSYYHQNTKGKRYQGFRSRSVYYTIDDQPDYEGAEQGYYHNPYYVSNKQRSSSYHGSLLNEDRDLRPATFIRDIQEKSQMIEEEKANYHAGSATQADHYTVSSKVQDDKSQQFYSYAKLSKKHGMIPSKYQSNYRYPN